MKEYKRNLASENTEEIEKNASTLSDGVSCLTGWKCDSGSNKHYPGISNYIQINTGTGQLYLLPCPTL